MASTSENLLAHFEAALPGMKANWARIQERGYQARLNGQSRDIHHRRHRGCFHRGWDAADADIKAGKVTVPNE